MNLFQSKTIDKAINTIKAYDEGLIHHHCLNAQDIIFINSISKKSEDYEISEKDNHRLNVIRGKI